MAIQSLTFVQAFDFFRAHRRCLHLRKIYFRSTGSSPNCMCYSFVLRPKYRILTVYRHGCLFVTNGGRLWKHIGALYTI